MQDKEQEPVGRMVPTEEQPANIGPPSKGTVMTKEAFQKRQVVENRTSSLIPRRKEAING